MATEEDDTFDIDIYGDEVDYSEPTQAPQVDENNFLDDPYEADLSTTNDGPDGNHDSKAQAIAGSEHVPEDQTVTRPTNATVRDSQTPQQGIKRKAPDDGLPEGPEIDHDPNDSTVDGFPVSLDARHTPATDPRATQALRLDELQWWTTEEDLRSYCAKAGVEDQLNEVSFGEHKINGKSRGEAYLEFESAGAAEKVKAELEKEVKTTANLSGGKRKEWAIQFVSAGTGFRMPTTGAGPKKEYQQQSYNRGGYNNNSDRGNFNRGNFRGNFQNRGGFNNNNNRGGMYQQSTPNQGGWNNANGMGGGMGNMGGGFNPMMANMMNMGGFNNMNRGGGMMGGMMPNMGGMGMNRGGMMGMGMGMMGRGGWGGGGGGFQGQGQGGWQGGGGGMGYGDGNKRARME